MSTATENIAPAEVALRDAGFRMLLPGTWAVIPLKDQKRADAIVARLVKERIGRDDRLAAVRRDAKDRLTVVVQQARDAEALQLALSMEILPGIPFPASLLVTERSWTADAAASTDVGARLAAMLPGGELVDLDAGPTIRAVKQVTITPGQEEITDTKLQYLVARPGGRGLLHITIDAPVECDVDLLVALFDAIVDSIRWDEAGPDAD